jgi:hypothetical protein
MEGKWKASLHRLLGKYTPACAPLTQTDSQSASSRTVRTMPVARQRKEWTKTLGPSDNFVAPLVCKASILPKVATRHAQPIPCVTKIPFGDLKGTTRLGCPDFHRMWINPRWTKIFGFMTSCDNFQLASWILRSGEGTKLWRSLSHLRLLLGYPVDFFCGLQSLVADPIDRSIRSGNRLSCASARSASCLLSHLGAFA